MFIYGLGTLQVRVLDKSLIFYVTGQTINVGTKSLAEAFLK